MTEDKRMEEIVERFGEVSRILVEEKEVEGLGTMRTYAGGATEEQKDWLRTTLTQYHQDLMSEVVEKLSGIIGAVKMGIITKEQGYSDLLEQLEAQTIIKSLTPPISRMGGKRIDGIMHSFATLMYGGSGGRVEATALHLKYAFIGPLATALLTLGVRPRHQRGGAVEYFLCITPASDNIGGILARC